MNTDLYNAYMNELTNKTPLTSISVSEALQNILAEFAPLEAVAVPLSELLGLVLAEDVYSDIDIPPFDNSSMDWVRPEGRGC